jgi:hypothetical protein
MEWLHRWDGYRVGMVTQVGWLHRWDVMVVVGVDGRCWSMNVCVPSKFIY